MYRITVDDILDFAIMRCNQEHKLTGWDIPETNKLRAEARSDAFGEIIDYISGPDEEEEEDWAGTSNEGGRTSSAGVLQGSQDQEQEYFRWAGNIVVPNR